MIRFFASSELESYILFCYDCKMKQLHHLWRIWGIFEVEGEAFLLRSMSIISCE